MIYHIPRVIIAGLSGDSGKTLLTLGLIANLKNSYRLAIFKKGPDFIDPLWLSIAANSSAKNLDTFLMGRNKVLEYFLKNSFQSDLAIIEGNRGLYDGFDYKGSHSTAQLAKLINAPVILIINATKVTRTIAALVYGCKFFDKRVNIKGVVLNNVAGNRHSDIISKSIESYTGLRVIGTIPKINNKVILPSRHLGLTTPSEIDYAKSSIEDIKTIISDNVDLNLVINIAKKAKSLSYNKIKIKKDKETKVKIGIFKDKAFSFYYPENLEALKQEGAEIVQLSSVQRLDDSETYQQLEQIDGLYIGGGFPEVHIDEISSNEKLLTKIKELADKWLPIYAECGGLIYLANEIEINNNKYKLSNILPIKVKFYTKPKGHGYTILKVYKHNPYFKLNSKIKAHEFHYTNIEKPENLETCFDVIRGQGVINNKEGLQYKNVLGTYMHINAIGIPQWAKNFVKCAFQYKEKREK